MTDSSSNEPRRYADPLSAHIGGKIRLRRAEHGIGNIELALRIGATIEELADIEAGLESVDPARLVLIAEILGVSIFWFFEEIPDELRPSRPSPARPHTVGGGVIELTHPGTEHAGGAWSARPRTKCDRSTT